MAEFWTGLALKAAAFLGGKAAERVLREDYTSRAIDAVDVDLGGRFEGLRYQLDLYVCTADYAERLAHLRAGRTDAVDKVAVAAFLEATDFHAGRRTRTAAAEILSAFFAELSRAMREDRAEAPHLQAARTEVLAAEVRETVRAEVGALRAEFIRGAPREEAGAARVAGEEALNARVDAARDVLNAGQPTPARRLLESVRRDLEATEASASLRFRVAANLGACALQEDDFTAARAEFQTAYALDPSAAKALTNLALVDLLEGDPRGAVALTRRALGLADSDSEAMAVHILVLGRMNDDVEIARIRSEHAWIDTDATCAHALGLVAYNAGRFDEAERWYSASLRSDPEDAQVRSRLALALIGSVQGPAYDDPPVADSARAAIRQKLEDAEGLLTTAIDTYRRRERRQELHEALVSRSAVRSMLFRFDEALDDARLVLLDNPEPRAADAAWNNQGRAYLVTNRAREAIASFEAIASDEARQEVAFALSTAYEQAGEQRKALNVLLDLWERTSPGRNQLHIADLLIRVSHTVGEPERVPAILDQLSTQFGDDPDLAVVVAAERKRGGDEQGAIAVLRDALSRSTGNARDRVAIQLAEHLVHKGVFGEAADLYASVVAEPARGPLARQLLLTLYNAGRYRGRIAGAPAGVYRRLYRS